METGSPQEIPPGLGDRSHDPGIGSLACYPLHHRRSPEAQYHRADRPNVSESALLPNRPVAKKTPFLRLGTLHNNDG